MIASLRSEPAAPLALAVVLLGLCGGLALVRQQPPSPAGPEDPGFSAVRARARLARVLGDQAPHPVGSPANRAVRDRLVAELGSLGLAPEVQERYWFRDGRANGAPVANVVARIEGRRDLPAILLAAHYDSRPHTAGASDDGMGVAALLEVGDRLVRQGPLLRPVILLFSDGEEWDLLGADLFARTHPLARRIAAVVNLECRGTGGPVLLFETGPRSGPLVAAHARSAPQPIASSLFPVVYRHLPNDTDFTAFRAAGLEGLNLAAIGAPQRYHTVLDRLEYASSETLQHMGETTLGLVRDLGNREEGLAGPTLAFQSLLGLAVVRVPIGWIPALAGAVFLFVLLVLRRRGHRPGAVLVGLYRLGLAILVTLAAAAVSFRILGGLGDPARWPAEPAWNRLVLIGAAVLALGWCRGRGVAAPRAEDLDAAHALGGTLVAGAIAAWSPELGLLALVPLATRMVGLALLGSGALGVTLSASGIWLVLVPLFGLVEDGLGYSLPLLPALVVALLAAPLLALVPPGSRVVDGVGLVLLVGGGALAVLRPAYTEALPRPLSLVYADDQRFGTASWIAATEGSRLPAGLAACRDFLGPRPASLAGFKDLPVFQAKAPPRLVPGPTLEVESEVREADGTRRLALRLGSGRAASVVGLAVRTRERVVGLTVEGVELGASVGGTDRPVRAVVPADGSVRVEMRVTGEDPLSCTLQDWSPGLPREGADLLEARPRTAGAVHAGDFTTVSVERVVGAGPDGSSPP